MHVVADRPFSTLFASIEFLDPPSGSGEPVDGFVELSLPEPSADAIVQFVLTPGISEPFRWLLRAADADAVGPVAASEVNLSRVATGDVQISLAWFADVDMDLHVVEPGGEEISWASTRSASGGELDLDSICDGVRNENIAWPDGPAPRGHYVVRVRYFDTCQIDRPPVDYVVTIQRANRSPETFEGHIADRGATATVTEFDF
jgi:hypothetical protein